MMRDGVDLSRGVDLAAVANKAKHQHRWVVVGQFTIDDKTMVALAEDKLKRDGGAEVPPTPIPLDGSNMFNLAGPGCMKCGFHWEAPVTFVPNFGQTGGYGERCPVNDDDWEKQTGQKLPPVTANADSSVGGDHAVEEKAA